MGTFILTLSPYRFATVVSSLGWHPFWVRNTIRSY